MAIQGLASLNRKFNKLPDAARAAISAAMEESAQEVVNFAKGLAPVDDGDLRNSIAWTWGEVPKGAIVLGTVRRKLQSTLKITIYAGDDKAFYARWVEFGTAPHINGGIFAGTDHPGTPAQPFFYPAYRAVRRRVRGRVTRAINKSAKQVAAGK